MMTRMLGAGVTVGFALALAGCGGGAPEAQAPVAAPQTSATPTAAKPAPAAPDSAGNRDGDRGVSQVGFERSTKIFRSYHTADVNACVGSDTSPRVCTYTLSSVAAAQAAHMLTQATLLTPGGTKMTHTWPGTIVSSTDWDNCTPCTLTNVDLQMVTRVPSGTESTVAIKALKGAGQVTVAFKVKDADGADAVSRLLQAGSLAPELSSLDVDTGAGTFAFTFTLPSPV